MKQINRMIATVLLLSLLACGAVVLFTQESWKMNNGRDKVELSRAKVSINRYEENIGQPVASLDQLLAFEEIDHCFILDVAFHAWDEHPEAAIQMLLQQSGEHFALHATEKGCYRIDYQTDTAGYLSGIRITLIAVISIFGLICLLILVYIKMNVVKPFQRLSDLPYELSKGNLTVPIEESKNKLFGRYLWGMNMLRENLEQAKERELFMVKEKKVLLLSLSHDIKTPLSAIKLYGKAFEKNLYRDEEKKQQVARGICEKADEIEAYISKIVQASNEDFLDFDISCTEYYIADVIKEIDAYYNEKMKLSQIIFEIGKYTNYLVYGDPARLVEVLQNIIENAIKYGDGKQILIHFRNDEEGYAITVENTGCTMEKRELPHVFDSFFRGSNTGRQPGSGLGLYICRKLMHMMDGEIVANIREEEQERFMCVTVYVKKA
ncbi:MAG: HAMP domain-containing sensor histidine kinase [Eubacteriales bacterium]|nr:HAMP domain-containing sensor histidine kinase [Eubacteriales bacterium]